MVGYALAAFPQKPFWLEMLLSEKFFTACGKHASLKKNERNIYCIDCGVGICQHCLSIHNSHRLLQIRRYVYHDVIRLQDIQRLVDCTQVQTYIINSARVVFLNQRPQPRPSRGVGNVCETCERSLQEAYRYCSVACKVDAVLAQGKDIQILLPCWSSRLHLPDLLHKPCESDAEEHSENSIMENSCSPTSSGSSANDGSAWENDLAVMTNFRTLPPKKIFSRCYEKIAISPRSVILASFHRRKGTPHRSPFC